MLLPLACNHAEARRRWFFGLRERQTLHAQNINGTPVEVPQPRMVSFIGGSLA